MLLLKGAFYWTRFPKYNFSSQTYFSHSSLLVLLSDFQTHNFCNQPFSPCKLANHGNRHPPPLFSLCCRISHCWGLKRLWQIKLLGTASINLPLTQNWRETHRGKIPKDISTNIFGEELGISSFAFETHADDALGGLFSLLLASYTEMKRSPEEVRLRTTMVYCARFLSQNLLELECSRRFIFASVDLSFQIAVCMCDIFGSMRAFLFLFRSLSKAYTRKSVER